MTSTVTVDIRAKTVSVIDDDGITMIIPFQFIKHNGVTDLNSIYLVPSLSINIDIDTSELVLELRPITADISNLRVVGRP